MGMSEAQLRRLVRLLKAGRLQQPHQQVPGGREEVQQWR